MGQEKIEPGLKPRVVLDTNVFISALLFRGTPGRLVSLWQKGEIVFLVSGDVLNEYLRVLAYPKFRLTEEEIRALIEVEVLPFTEPVRVLRRLRLVKEDPSDDKFLELAIDGKADFVVSSDKHLLKLAVCRSIEILPPAEFFKRL